MTQKRCPMGNETITNCLDCPEHQESASEDVDHLRYLTRATPGVMVKIPAAVGPPDDHFLDTRLQPSKRDPGREFQSVDFPIAVHHVGQAAR